MLRTAEDAAGLPVGYFGASTGRARHCAPPPTRYRRFRGGVPRGRPDLAGDFPAGVSAPTLLIVGSRDEVVLDLNRQAAAAIPAECRIAVVEGPPTSSRNPAPLNRSRCWPGLVRRPLDTDSVAAVSNRDSVLIGAGELSELGSTPAILDVRWRLDEPDGRPPTGRVTSPVRCTSRWRTI